MDNPDPLLYLAIGLLLALSAFFSCSETAISSVNRLRLKKSAEDGNKGAKVALRILDHYDKALFSILIGNNIVNIAASAIATVLFTSLVGTSGPAVATGVMTVLVLVFGEILPKSYARDYADKVTPIVARPLRYVTGFLTPLTWLFMKLRGLFGPGPDAGPTYTEEELHYMMESVRQEGVLEEQERDLVQSALEFDDIAVWEVITPRVNVVALDVEADEDEVRGTVFGNQFSRIPIFEENIDNIIGMIYTRDYMEQLLKGEPANIRDLLTEVLFVHRTVRLPQLLTSLKTRKIGLAVVTDDYGGTLGIATSSDVVEELVGDLWDEDEGEAGSLLVYSADHCEVLGAHSLGDMLEDLDWEEYELDADYTTVNGWAMHIFGNIPKPGDTAVYMDLTLRVLEMEGNVIRRLEIKRERPEEDGADGEED